MAAATTTTISSTLAVVLLLCAASLAATGAAGSHHHLEANKGNDLVARTCATVTRRRYRGPGLTRQFCESALRSDMRSAAARDPRDLALVAMDLVRSGAADADTKVGGALRSGATAKWSKHTMLRLHYCRQDHNEVARTVPACRALVQEYDPRRRAAGSRRGQGHGSGNLIPSEYLECAGRLVHAADDCWVHIDGEAKKAVWKEVVEVASRANLAKAMVEQMVGVADDDDDH